MSLVRAAFEKLGVNVEHFWAWGEKASVGRHKKLFDAYEKSVSDIEIAESKFQTWIQQNWQKGSFEPDYSHWDKRLKGLQKRSLARLEAIFRAYKKHVSQASNL